jgi:hypothetical protein
MIQLFPDHVSFLSPQNARGPTFFFAWGAPSREQVFLAHDKKLLRPRASEFFAAGFVMVQEVWIYNQSKFEIEIQKFKILKNCQTYSRLKK